MEKPEGEKKVYTLLLADDQGSNLLALKTILESEYHILSAQSGEEAIKLASAHLPDLILLDVIMPGMDGYEAIQILKSQSETRGIPVIFVTGLRNDAAEEKGLQLRAVDYINKPFNPAIVQLRVRNQIKMVEQLRTIEELSLSDQMTGIPNRRAFDQRMSIEWNRALREKLPLSVMMIDVDKFKSYNDTYGHSQGDQALRTVAHGLLRALFRSTDFAARWGGEEFSVLLSGVTYKEAYIVAERIRNEVANATIPDAGAAGTRVTISIGVYTGIPDAKTTSADFVARADVALYAAKQGGRNRVCCG